MYQALPSFLHVKDSTIAGLGLFAKEDIPNDVYKYFEEFVNKKIASYEKLKNNEKIDFRESDFSKSFAELKSSSVKENISTRDSSGVILNKLSEESNLFIGGAAD